MAKRKKGIRLECPECFEDVLIVDDIEAGIFVECDACGQKAKVRKRKKTNEWVLDPVSEED